MHDDTTTAREREPDVFSTHAPARTAPAQLFLHTLGPGLITGASDDDPSGIATYSQVGRTVRLLDPVDHAVFPIR